MCPKLAGGRLARSDPLSERYPAAGGLVNKSLAGWRDMKNDPRTREPSGQSASNQTRSNRRQPDSEQDWRILSEALLTPARLTEEELDAFKRIWHAPRRVLNQVLWDKETRTHKATGSRAAVGLTQKQKDETDAHAEKYGSVEEYRLDVLFSRSARQLYQARFAIDDSYRGLCHEAIDLLFRDSKMKSGSSYASKRITEQMSWIDKVLRSRFGLPVESHRPRSQEDQHRKWSRMLYLGRKLKEIAEKTGQDEAHIQKSVARYRKRREPIQWVLRYLIYHQHYDRRT